MYGVSRSTTIVAAYLMKSEKLSQATALQSIVTIKPSVKLVNYMTAILEVLVSCVARPNSGFMKQLEIWEEMRCCIDPQHKSFKSYRLGKMAKVMKGKLKLCSHGTPCEIPLSNGTWAELLVATPLQYLGGACYASSSCLVQ